MNRKEWEIAYKEGTAIKKYDWASRRIQRSLVYNPDPSATVRHHLMDTHEQVKYNNEHYELWGFEIDEDGNEHFEYGKYIIFVTPDEHLQMHHICDYTREKMSKALYKNWQNENYRRSQINAIKHGMNNDECRKKLSEKSKKNWENETFRETIINSLKSRQVSEETRKKLSEAQVAAWDNEERRTDISKRYSGEGNPFYGKHHSEETRIRMGESIKGKCSGENNGMYGKRGELNPNYGKRLSDEQRQAVSKALKGKSKSELHKQHWCESMSSEESKRKQREPKLGEKNPNFGKHPSEETRKKLSEASKASRTDDVKRKIGKSIRDRMAIMKHAYALYKSNNGELKWNDFQKICTVNVETNTYILNEG